MLHEEPARLARLRDNARRHAERFSWDHTTAQLRDVYREATTSLAEQREVVHD
jgi:D-inositol-3-phosphate glycosyltransferase